MLCTIFHQWVSSKGRRIHIIVLDLSLVSVHVMSVLVCLFMVISKYWLLMHLKLPSITASPFFSASTTRLYKSMFFTLILLAVDHDVARNSLCCVVYHMLLINPTVHLWSQSHKLRDAMSVVLVLEDGSRQLLLKLRNDSNEGNLLLSTS